MMANPMSAFGGKEKTKKKTVVSTDGADARVQAVAGYANS